MAQGRHSHPETAAFLVTSPSVCTPQGAEAVMDICGGVGIDAFDKIMFAEKGSGQGQQNQSLGNIAYGTEIQYPVMIDSGRAEHEIRRLRVTVTHTGYEQKAGEFYGSFLSCTLSSSVSVQETLWAVISCFKAIPR